MPTYDYRCDACEHEFELFQSIKADPQRKCPRCGKNKLRRLIGPGAAIVFKGSGFYKTDYRSESYKKQAAAEKPATDAKPAESKTADKTSSDAAKGKKKHDAA
jgi:putative FmdB family regulatory protein